MDELPEELNKGERFKLGKSNQIFVVVKIEKDNVFFKLFDDKSEDNLYRTFKKNVKSLKIHKPEYMNELYKRRPCSDS